MSTSNPLLISVGPIELPYPDGGDLPLQVRVTAPSSGQQLPVVVFSHGYGSSKDASQPLVDAWAAAGLVVVQPTHLDAVALGLPPTDPRLVDNWRRRIADLRLVIDELETIEAAVPGLEGRVDRDRVAAAGHSFGATSASALLGARTLGPVGNPDEDFTDARVTAGVLLSVPGEDHDDLTPLAVQAFPFMRPRFQELRTPTLVVAGDRDQSPLSTRGPDWFTDAYRLAPGAEHLLTVHGGEHTLGGVHKPLGMPETPADDPAKVLLVQQATTAWLQTALGVAHDAWSAFQAGVPTELGTLDSK